MTRPQQPELDRSGRGATDQRSAEAKAGQDPRAPRADEGSGATPSANISTDQRKSGTRSTSRDAQVE